MKKNLENLVSNSLIYLITDNKLDRTSWKRVLNGLSATPDQMVIFDDFQSAEKAIKRKAPRILISAYEIEDVKADSMLEAFREASPDLSEDLCVIVADHEDARVKLACLELEIDGVLVKPYAAGSLAAKITELLIKKLSMTKAQKARARAMKFLREGQLEKVGEFIDQNEAAGAKDPEIARLKGEYLKMAGRSLDAATIYRDLCHSYGSYHSWTSLFDILVLESKAEEAFQAARAMMERFPLHPKRLSNFIKVCILSSNYHALVELASEALRMGVDDEAYGQQLAAGLAICGKSIGASDKKVAVEASVRAARLGKGRTPIVEQALKTLLELKKYKLVKELTEELSQESDELRIALDIADYRVLEAEGGEPFLLFKMGMDLTNRGVHDFHVYEVLLRSAKRVGRKPDSIEEITENACKHNPQKSDYFKKLAA